jgi:hypothetical protein
VPAPVVHTELAQLARTAVRRLSSLTMAAVLATAAAAGSYALASFGTGRLRVLRGAPVSQHRVNAVRSEDPCKKLSFVHTILALFSLCVMHSIVCNSATSQIFAFSQKVSGLQASKRDLRGVLKGDAPERVKGSLPSRRSAM